MRSSFFSLIIKQNQQFVKMYLLLSCANSKYRIEIKCNFIDHFGWWNQNGSGSYCLEQHTHIPIPSANYRKRHEHSRDKI